ncbi:MAG: lysophospholipid acyltransferase family protein [Arenicellales bacterium WSBS_2016_MAG_OTU3]
MPPLLRARIIGGWAHFMIWWLKVTCGLTHAVRGKENLPSQPSVILSKHQSAWETIAFQTIFPPQAWVLKKELLYIPFFGWGLAASKPIAIDRKLGVKALGHIAKQGKQRLQEGRWVVVFPEGTRMMPGEKGRYNVGGSILAARAGADIVPVAHNAGLYWAKRGFLKRPGVIQLSVGPVIKTEGKKAKQITQEVEAWIEEEMTQL